MHKNAKTRHKSAKHHTVHKKTLAALATRVQSNYTKNYLVQNTNSEEARIVSVNELTINGRSTYMEIQLHFHTVEFIYKGRSFHFIVTRSCNAVTIQSQRIDAFIIDGIAIRIRGYPSARSTVLTYKEVKCKPIINRVENHFQIPVIESITSRCSRTDIPNVLLPHGIKARRTTRNCCLRNVSYILMRIDLHIQWNHRCRRDIYLYTRSTESHLFIDFSPLNFHDVCIVITQGIFQLNPIHRKGERLFGIHRLSRFEPG